MCGFEELLHVLGVIQFMCVELFAASLLPFEEGDVHVFMHWNDFLSFLVLPHVVSFFCLSVLLAVSQCAEKK